MKMARSMSKRTAFGKTTYKIDGREVPKEEYEKTVNAMDVSGTLKPDTQYMINTKYIGTKPSGRDKRCPEGYHWVNTYHRRKKRFFYTVETVRGHCARDK